MPTPVSSPLHKPGADHDLNWKSKLLIAAEGVGWLSFFRPDLLTDAFGDFYEVRLQANPHHVSTPHKYRHTPTNWRSEGHVTRCSLRHYYKMKGMLQKRPKKQMAADRGGKELHV
ncbi:hypothetical protein IAQ61_010431 [Plenodomus lingam]|uniref:Predicted protein n=1 Tax=Leptosphaeria maculans (strain JN3 / isolate v23.1.3 / race Av1-4-5-6-7-8) TaxID=985895 RepID=E5A3Y7_LEPMJ|nr:predicted protein [Plenodomus lingam JN3]KAH9862228.1 hypothetical protein IAQ61_010431 [Plenodomus lingam]CBX98332.1 predicted protein [Plenodomus lingam JN3]